jgi:hypothetical protein
MLSNIWNHPKTSVTGLLLSVVTIVGVLSQQGITLGNAGAGTVVTLIAGLATALLGLLSRDPVTDTNSTGSTAKLGALMLCVIVVMGTMPMTGCSGVTVAQDIVNWTPALQSAVAMANSTCTILDPAAIPICAAVTVGFTAGSNVLVAQANAYLANPNATVLQQLQVAVVTFQQQVNASLLNAARIVNPDSQQKTLAQVNAVGTVVNAMLALVLSITAKTAAQKMAVTAPIKVAMLMPYIRNDLTAEIVAAHYGVPTDEGRLIADHGEQLLVASGF